MTQTTLTAAKRILLAAALVLAACTAAHAASSGIWTQYGAETFIRGELENISLTNDGVMKLGLNSHSIMESTEPYIWSVVQGPKGILYAGSGNKAILYQITPDGQARELAMLPGIGITSLAVDKKGNIYAGIFPTGEVYKLDKTGTRELLTSLPARFVWALDFDAQGNLLAATGSPAGIYRLSGEGELLNLLAATERHILCFAQDENGDIFAGSSPSGLIYHVDVKDQKFNVLYDLDEDEAYRMLYLGGGEMLIAANSNQSPPAGPPPGPGAQNQQNAGAREEPASFPIPYSAPQDPAQVAPAKIYRLNKNGDIQKLFTLPDPFILTLHQLDDTKFLAGTGNRGNVYALDLETEQTVLHQLPVRQVLHIADGKKGEYFTTGNPGAIYTIDAVHNATGTYVSPVNDTYGLAQWGRLWVDADIPQGTRIEFSLRTGNTTDPEDGTWTDWCDPITDLPAQIPNRAGRFIQYRADFYATDTRMTPTLREVNIAYLTSNKPPVIQEFTFTPKPTKRQPPKSNDKNGGGGGGDDSAPEELNIQVGTVFARQEMAITWKAVDPDRDGIEYSLYFRRLPGSNWNVLVDEFYGAEYRWNTESVPDGKYELKLVADDIPSNPENRARREHKISEQFIVDNSRPAVIASAEADGADAVIISGMATDPTSIIAALEYSYDDLDWRMLIPKDNIFDSDTEPFRFRLDELEKGDHSVIVRARDFTGNIASISLQFTVK